MNRKKICGSKLILVSFSSVIGDKNTKKLKNIHDQLYNYESTNNFRRI